MLNWSIIQSRPRWEKKVAQLLISKGVETFCPLIREQRQWSDRIKTIEKPLLKSFLFVRIEEAQRTSVRLTEGVINFVYRNGKPVLVKDKVVQSIRQFQMLHESVRAVETDGLTQPPSTGSGQGEVKSNGATLCIETLGIVLVGGTVQPTSPKASTAKL